MAKDTVITNLFPGHGTVRYCTLLELISSASDDRIVRMNVKVIDVFHPKMDDWLGALDFVLPSDLTGLMPEPQQPNASVGIPKPRKLWISYWDEPMFAQSLRARWTCGTFRSLNLYGFNERVLPAIKATAKYTR